MKLALFIFLGIYVWFGASGEYSLSAFPGDHKNGLTCPIFRADDVGADKCRSSTSGFYPGKILTIDTPVDNIRPQCAREIHDQGNQFTMFGDSLTDFVNDPRYGIFNFAYYLNAVGGGQYNKIQNFAREGNWSSDLVNRITGGAAVQFTNPLTTTAKVPRPGVTNMCLPNAPNPERNEKSSPRSVVMIGGNDVIKNLPLVFVFPVFKKYQVRYIVSNVRKFVDWNLENGKSVLMLGTMPIESLGIKNYNIGYVNRHTLCNGIEPPSNVPWWLLLFYPRVARVLIGEYQKAQADFADFYRKMFDNMGEGYKIMSSITQACINDKLRDEVAPAYKTAYPNRVEFDSLYDRFSTGFNSALAPNFWQPHEGLYVKWFEIKDFRNFSNGDATRDEMDKGPGQNNLTIYFVGEIV